MLPQSGNVFLSFYFLALIFQLHLFHADGIDRADIDTDTAIHTGVGVDFGLVFGHTDSLARALTDTSFATCAFFHIYFCRHLRSFHTDNKTTVKTGHFYRIDIGLQPQITQIFPDT